MTACGPVLIYAQHLLGSGHLRRAALLARACAAGGIETSLVSGGMPVPDLDTGDADLVQLAPLRAESSAFARLLDAEGDEIDDGFRARRRDELLAVLDRIAPRAVVVEMFPFGRRQMRFELLPFLEAARARTPRPVIVSSVRDILQTGRKPARVEESARWAETLFDHVLVHGDPGFVRFEETFPPAARLGDRLHYTGMLAPARDDDTSGAGSGEVIVSAGGGAVGAELLSAAIAARADTALKTHTWRLLVGSAMASAEIGALRREAPDGVMVEPARPDFLTLLANCAVSVSQGGYNTVADILSAGAKAVIVPFAADGETEQTLRARKLAACGRATMVSENELSPDTLARAVDQAFRIDPAGIAIDLDGAAASVRLLKTWLTGRRSDD